MSTRMGLWVVGASAFAGIGIVMGLPYVGDGTAIENPTQIVFAQTDNIPDADKLNYVSGIQHIVEKPDFGGEACLVMYLKFAGHNVDQDSIFDASGVDPILGRGCSTTELVNVAKKIGIETGPVWLEIDDDRSLMTAWEAIRRDLKDNRPSVVCRVESGDERFVLVIGHDAKKNEVIFHNPADRNGADQREGLDAFLKHCVLESKGQGDRRRTMAWIRLAGDSLDVPEPSSKLTDADFSQHIRELRNRLPHDGFHVVLQKPFVVVGDGTLRQVQTSATQTVKWSVDLIKRDYFSRDPNYIIDIWLFKDPPSYRKHNQILFKTKPSTPFGYFSPANRALVMDISTGGGTLVHEIVHPFIESNFPGCPSWFNEGLASLYEQCSQRDGHIIGLTNWRLRGLQATIADGRLPSFEDLCSTSRREFYDGAGSNYSQARYLCYYLQEKGLLIKFYHQFKKNVDADPSGLETLKTVMGKSDLIQFQKDWELFVTKLKFGR